MCDDAISFAMKARCAKPSLTVEDQVRLLESRGMGIADSKFAANALSTVSYYRLSAYSYPFRSCPEGVRFRDGTPSAAVLCYTIPVLSGIRRAIASCRKAVATAVR